MSAESIRLINAAIAVTQCNAITSVNDGSPEAVLADLKYEDMAQTALCRSRWKFARKVVEATLVRALTDADSTTYGYEWQLPDDFLTLRTLTINGSPIDYIIQENGIVWTVDSTIPKAVYTYRAPESIWPPDFKTAFGVRLEAVFLKLDEKYTEAGNRNEEADVLFSRCALVHSQEEATHEHKRYPLIAARRTGYASRRC